MMKARSKPLLTILAMVPGKMLMLISIVILPTGLVLGQGPSQGKILMAIFAHPDDELTVAPILSKYAREGARVYLVICTDGRYGTNDFSGLKAGDGLAALRRDEMKCSADKLGVELIHLTYHDQLKAAEGYDGHVPHARALLTELHQIVSDKKPDVLITWAPDGGTTHMDHRLVGASVTQVFVSKLWTKPVSLFYTGTPSDRIEDPADKILWGIDPRYMNTRITYTDDDLMKAAASMECHKSQLTPKDVQAIVDRRRKSGMTIFLMEFVGPTKSRDSVF